MNVFNVYLSDHAIKHLCISFIVRLIQEMFEWQVQYFKHAAEPGEFDRFGGPRGAVIHNLKLAFSRCRQEREMNKIRQRLTEFIPELA